MKKNLLTALIILGGTFLLNSQTNTFPTSGSAGIGTTGPEGDLHILSNAIGGTTFFAERVNDHFGGSAFVYRKARGTIATKTVPLDNDVVGGLFAQAWDGSQWRPTATVRFFVDGNVTGSSSPGKIAFQTQASGENKPASQLEDRLVIKQNGHVGIGTGNPQSPLSVKGKIESQEIQVVANVADYVFKEDYDLMDLESLESFIFENGHLPKMQNEKDVENNRGFVKLGELSISLMEKVEELTLHLIELNKRVKNLEKENDLLKSKLNK